MFAETNFEAKVMPDHLARAAPCYGTLEAAKSDDDEELSWERLGWHLASGASWTVT